MVNWDLLYRYKDSSTSTINIIYYIGKIKDKINISKDEEKAFDKASEFMIKSSQSEYRGNVPHHNKDYT